MTTSRTIQKPSRERRRPLGALASCRPSPPQATTPNPEYQLPTPKRGPLGALASCRPSPPQATHPTRESTHNPRPTGNTGALTRAPHPTASVLPPLKLSPISAPEIFNLLRSPFGLPRLPHILRFSYIPHVIALALILIASLQIASAETIQIENPGALPVIDNANLLTPGQEQSISAKLKSLASTDGTQLAVLTVPTTGDEDIFTFTQRTATEWGIGQKEENSGVLFVIASQDRKSRIHVGYGLEGRLTDALSKRILSTQVSPEFKAGRFYEGIDKGVDSIIAAVKGEYKAPQRESTSNRSNAISNIIIIALILYFIISAIRRGRGGRGGRGGGGGPGILMLPNVWTTGGHSSGGWGHSGGDFGGGGGFGGGFGGGSFGGGGASDSW